LVMALKLGIFGTIKETRKSQSFAQSSVFPPVPRLVRTTTHPFCLDLHSMMFMNNSFLDWTPE
jgi:hypothetical protein